MKSYYNVYLLVKIIFLTMKVDGFNTDYKFLIFFHKNKPV